MAKTTLTAEDRRAIALAVGRAEEGTAGEIVCVLAPEADDYAEIPVAWAALAALVLPFLAVWAGLHPTLHLAALGGTGGWDAPAARDAGPSTVDTVGALVALQAATFALVFALGQVPAVRRFLTPAPLKRAKVHKGALSQFSATGLAAAPDRTGVLIYASLGDRMVEVVADKLIHDRVGEGEWRKAAAAVSHGMKGGVTGGGFVHAVEVCGAALAAHFPPAGPRANAFPDELREL